MEPNTNEGGSAVADSHDNKPLTRRAKDIIARPKEEWPRIEAEPATIGGIYTSYVVPLAAIPPVASVIGALVVGYPSLFGLVYQPPAGVVIAGAVVQYVLTLIGVYVMALIIEALAPTFGGVKDRLMAFKVAAYSATAGWLAGIFNLIPALAFLGLLGLYGLYLLYLGLPRLMKAPDDKALGYTIAAVVAAIVVWIGIGFLATLLVGAFAGPSIGVL